MRSIVLLSLCGLLIFSSISCSTKAPKLKLNRIEKSMIDSLYKQEIPILDSVLTEQCANYRRDKYQEMKDSIIEVRLEEIEDILPR